MISISPVQEKILRNLARYKYLTADQLLRLGVSNHKQTVYTALVELRSKKLTSSLIYGAVTRIGTTAKLNFLSLQGVKLLSELTDIGLIRYPKATSTMFKNDFFHRIHTVDLMIGYDTWLNETLNLPLFYDTYFDTIGSQKGILKSTSKTRFNLSDDLTVTPDTIFGFQTPSDEKRLFVLEITNGRDTGRTVRQIYTNLVAMYKKLISERYGIEKMPLLLVAFENEVHKEGVMKAVLSNNFTQKFVGLEKFLFFAMQNEATEQWATCWQNIKGIPSPIFQ